MKAASNREPDGGVIWFPPALAAGRSVPWWGLISAAAAFVAMVGECTVATALQPSYFNWLASTVSTLTEPGVADRWVTIAAFAVTGACGIATALALRPAALAGRLILAAAGAAAVLVAANPEHAGGSLAHGLWAAAAFTALIVWPVGAWRRGTSVPWGLRPSVSAAGVGGPARPAGLVPRRADDQRRDDRPGRAGHVRGASGLACGGSTVLPASSAAIITRT